MATKAVLEEVQNFIKYAVKNRKNISDHEKNLSPKALEEYEEQLISVLLRPVRPRKTDKELCEYAVLVSRSKGVTLSESIGYWILLMRMSN